MARIPKPPQGLPDRETLLAFLRDAGEAQKADIAKAFGLKGADRRAMRQMLTALREEGQLGKRGRKGFAPAGALPPGASPTSPSATPTANSMCAWSRARTTPPPSG